MSVELFIFQFLSYIMWICLVFLFWPPGGQSYFLSTSVDFSIFGLKWLFTCIGRDIPPAACLLPKFPKQLGLRQADAWNSIQVSHIDDRDPDIGAITPSTPVCPSEGSWFHRAALLPRLPYIGYRYPRCACNYYGSRLCLRRLFL